MLLTLGHVGALFLCAFQVSQILRNLDKKTFHWQKHRKLQHKKILLLLQFDISGYSCADTQLDHLRYTNSGPQTPCVYPCYNLLVNIDEWITQKISASNFFNSKMKLLVNKSRETKKLFRCTVYHSTKHRLILRAHFPSWICLASVPRGLNCYFLHDTLSSYVFCWLTFCLLLYWFVII